jgi:hypothetical protein
MPLIYKLDSNNVYSGTIDISKYDPVPPNSTLTSPPSLTGIWQFNNNEWIELQEYPVIVNNNALMVPDTLTIRRAKLVLHKNNLLATVNAAVASADEVTKIEWEYATEIKRNWPTLVAVQQSLGLTDEQVDNLFIEGSTL